VYPRRRTVKRLSVAALVLAGALSTGFPNFIRMKDEVLNSLRLPREFIVSMKR
jgi:hypothetical protein